MRLAAALICIALLLPAPAALAAPLHMGSTSADNPGEQVESIMRAQAPELAEGYVQVSHHQGTATTEPTPATVRTGSLLWWFLSIVIGQDRMTAQAGEPASP